MVDHEAGLLTECCELLNTISTYPDNKKCFDCNDNYSPRYLCTTFSTFVCSCCANIHNQEFGHSIKVLSVFSFTLNEIYVLKETGNRVAADKWLARWRSDLFMEPDPTSPTYKEDARKYIKAKYIEKRWVKMTPPLPLSIKRGEETEEPRGYADVSPRKGAPVEEDDEEELAVAQQHDDKSRSHAVLRDTFTPPSIMYVPQPMYIPMGMPGMPQVGMPGMPGQYGFPQYHPDTVVGQLPYYGPLYTYPYDNMHCLPPPIMSEGISWPSASKPKKRRPSTTAVHPDLSVSQQNITSAEELPPAPPGAIFRSVSDNSIVATYVVQRHPSKKDITYTRDTKPNSDAKPTSDTKPNNEPSKPLPPISSDSVSKTEIKISVSGKSDTKIKKSGFMNKVAGLLGKKT